MLKRYGMAPNFCAGSFQNMSTLTMAPQGARLATLLLLATLLSGCGINNIPTYDEQAKAAWAQVENQYQRRADLIPNLVETDKG